jgi:hypothetical protein
MVRAEGFDTYALCLPDQAAALSVAWHVEQVRDSPAP